MGGAGVTEIPTQYGGGGMGKREEGLEGQANRSRPLLVGITLMRGHLKQ